MKKKILLSITALAAIITGAVVWLVLSYFFSSQAEDRNAKKFIEEKYGMDAVIVSETGFNLVEGQSYQMAFEEQRDVVFTVTVEEVDYATIYRDDYEAVLSLHQVQQQTEELLPDIEALGFAAASGDKLADHAVKNMQTGETVRWLNLVTADDYETIERAEVEAMYNLLKLQRQYSIDIHKIHIRSKTNEHIMVMDLRTMEEVHSVEELEANVVGGDLRLAGKRFQTRWQEAASQAETERFRFQDEWEDGWVSCQAVNDEGSCINLLASVSFEAGELSRQSPYLEADLDAIFDFFDSIEPGLTTVDLIMTDPEREGDPVRFLLSERGKYASTAELIQALVKD